MTKIGRPARLIAYDTETNVDRRRAGKANVFNPIGARTVLYAIVIALVGGVMTFALATRVDLDVSAIHDRNPMFVKTADRSIRNGYLIEIVNRASADRIFEISVEGAQSPRLQAVGVEQAANGTLSAEVGPDQTRELRVTATLPGALNRPHSQDVAFRVTDMASGRTAVARDHFEAP